MITKFEFKEVCTINSFCPFFLLKFKAVELLTHTQKSAQLDRAHASALAKILQTRGGAPDSANAH
jgi:hypothetical protein